MTTVRVAEARDAGGIRAVQLAAFPTPVEADLIGTLERDGDAAISLVMEDEGIVGHVLLSRMDVEGDGRSYRALGLGPVAVLPRLQRRGAGTRLIETALAIAKEQGEELVFVLGEPAYYNRFGFSAEAARPFASPYAGFYFMALALRPDQPLPYSGKADYAPAFRALEAQE